MQNAIMDLIKIGEAKSLLYWEQIGIDFMKENLSNLAGLYSSSDIDQIKVLLGSIFPSGLTWDNFGRLNHQISPIFQAVRDTDRLNFAFGDPMGIRTPDSLDENQVS